MNSRHAAGSVFPRALFPPSELTCRKYLNMIHRTRLPARVIAGPARNIDCEAEHTWPPRFELKPENSVCDTWSGGRWETAPNRGWPSVQFRLKATPKISNNKFRRRAAARKDLKEPHAETAGPSTTLRSGRDDNSVAGSATVPSCLFQSLQNCHPDRSVA